MIEVGMLARSKAGHDKDQIFVIIRNRTGICISGRRKNKNRLPTKEKETETYSDYKGKAGYHRGG